MSRNLAVYNSGRNPNCDMVLFNWHAIVAAILVIGVGVSFWTGIGMMIAHLWK
jgi:hypothetical protein